MKFCEDCGNYTEMRKKCHGLLLCPNCYEVRSGKPFVGYKMYIPRRRRALVGAKKRKKLESMVRQP